MSDPVLIEMPKHKKKFLQWIQPISQFWIMREINEYPFTLYSMSFMNLHDFKAPYGMVTAHNMEFFNQSRLFILDDQDQWHELIIRFGHRLALSLDDRMPTMKAVVVSSWQYNDKFFKPPKERRGRIGERDHLCFHYWDKREERLW